MCFPTTLHNHADLRAMSMPPGASWTNLGLTDSVNACRDGKMANAGRKRNGFLRCSVNSLNFEFCNHCFFILTKAVRYFYYPQFWRYRSKTVFRKAVSMHRYFSIKGEPPKSNRLKTQIGLADSPYSSAKISAP